MICGTHYIKHNIPRHSPHSDLMWEISENIAQNIVNPIKHCYGFEKCYVLPSKDVNNGT